MRGVGVGVREAWSVVGSMEGGVAQWRSLDFFRNNLSPSGRGFSTRQVVRLTILTPFIL